MSSFRIDRISEEVRHAIDAIIRSETSNKTCDFDREGIIRNTSEMLTARQLEEDYRTLRQSLL